MICARPKKSGNVNIREIARKAGVSVASVSRALQNEPSNKISEELKKKILLICDEMQYYPNMHTVRMLKKRSNTIALLVPPECIHLELEQDSIDYNLAGAIGGVEKYLSENSMYVTIASMTEDFVANKEYLKFCRSKMVDGFIVWGITQNNKFIIELIEEKVPLVLIQGSRADVTCSRVNAQDYEGMSQIVQHIVSMGHTQIAYIPAPETSFAGIERNKGFYDAMNQVGLSPVFISSEAGFDPIHGYSAGLNIFKNKIKTTCIVASNDYAAFGVMKAASELKIRIPEDVSLTGADGLILPAQMQLTTYFSPSFQMGINAAELLCKIINNPGMKEENLRLPVRSISGMTVAKIN